MHRSGTSLTSGLIGRLGYTHGQNLIPADAWNPTGYWEPADLVALNDRLLQVVSRNWADPKPLPDGWWVTADVRGLEAEAAALLEAQYSTASGFPRGGAVFKDPRLSVLAPFWVPLWQRFEAQLAAIICVRHPMDVAASLAARDSMQEQHALSLWLTYTLSAERMTRPLRRGLVRYRALLEKSDAELQAAFAAVGLVCGQDIDREALSLEGLVDEQWHRHRNGGQVPRGEETVYRLVRDTWALLCGSNPLRQHARFDRLYEAWRADWAKRSPGCLGSKWERRLPGFHTEKSAQAQKRGAPPADIWRPALRAALMAPNRSQPWVHYGALLNQLGFPEAAIDAFQRALRIVPADPRGRIGLSLALHRAGRNEEAIAEAQHCIALAPTKVHYKAHLGNLLREAGRLEEAEEIIRQVLVQEPGFPNAHFSLSVLLTRSGRLEEAVSAARQARDLSPSTDRFERHLERLEARLADLAGKEAGKGKG